MEEIEGKNIFKIWPYIIMALVIVFILWICNLFMLIGYPDTYRGSFGDMFGPVNSLFTGLAFAGVIITILLQRHELELQREELKSTREEFKIQNKTLKVQRFENTFFQMLSLHHQIVDSIDEIVSRFVSKGNIFEREEKFETLKGRDVFKNTYENRLLICP